MASVTVEYVTNLDPMNRGLKLVVARCSPWSAPCPVTNLDPMNRGLKRTLAGGFLPSRIGYKPRPDE